MSKFTTQELDLASDPTILLIKHRMMEKVWEYMEELQEDLRVQMNDLQASVPQELNLKQGKISKGENYRHLPYAMLDFPASFSKKDTFAFRTMFYWGHFISTTFHLQGRFSKYFGELFCEEFKKLEGAYFCVNVSPWQYHYENNNYILFKSLKTDEIERHIENTDFIKISVKYPVEEMPDRKADIVDFLVRGLKLLETN